MRLIIVLATLFALGCSARDPVKLGPFYYSPSGNRLFSSTEFVVWDTVSKRRLPPLKMKITYGERIAQVAFPSDDCMWFARKGVYTYDWFSFDLKTGDVKAQGQAPTGPCVLNVDQTRMIGAGQEGFALVNLLDASVTRLDLGRGRFIPQALSPQAETAVISGEIRRLPGGQKLGAIPFSPDPFANPSNGWVALVSNTLVYASNDNFVARYTSAGEEVLQEDFKSTGKVRQNGYLLAPLGPDTVVWKEPLRPDKGVLYPGRVLGLQTGGHAVTLVSDGNGEDFKVQVEAGTTHKLHLRKVERQDFPPAASLIQLRPDGRQLVYPDYYAGKPVFVDL